MTCMSTPVRAPAPDARQTNRVRPPTARPPDAGQLRRRPARRPPVRLTTRGRVVALIALAVLAFGAVSLGRVVTIAATGGAPPQRDTVVVEPGQTLWQIADQIAPGVDPRITVGRLIEINGLDGPEVRVGQQLFVPRDDP
jgi:LysM repeat protein